MRAESWKAVRIPESARAGRSWHASIMPDSCTAATVFPPAARAASRPFSYLFSPTRFHEDPKLIVESSTLGVSRSRKRERGTSGRWRQSARRLGWAGIGGPPLHSRGLWLGIEARRAQKECDDLLVGSRACVHGAMHTRIRYIPIDHTRMHRHREPLSCLPELDRELLAAHDDREAMAGIGMPRHRFSGLEDEPPNHEIVAPCDDFRVHSVASSNAQATLRPSNPRLSGRPETPVGHDDDPLTGRAAPTVG